MTFNLSSILVFRIAQMLANFSRNTHSGCIISIVTTLQWPQVQMYSKLFVSYWINWFRFNIVSIQVLNGTHWILFSLAKPHNEPEFEKSTRMFSVLTQYCFFLLYFLRSFIVRTQQRLRLIEIYNICTLRLKNSNFLKFSFFAANQLIKKVPRKRYIKTYFSKKINRRRRKNWKKETSMIQNTFRN